MQLLQAETVPVSANMEHLLKIISERLFKDPYSPIREYIANARDASQKASDPAVHVYSTGDHIRISDRGCGMTRKVIEEGFTRIAGHFAHTDGATVGMFGLGVLSAFLICDYIEVETRNADEPHGWHLRWNRSEPQFTLTPSGRQTVGTDAVLHLVDEYRTLAVESAITDYVRRHFALFTVPIYVGNNRLPVNQAHAWFATQANDGVPHLLQPGPAFEVLYQHHKKRMSAAYSYRGPNGERVFLGIPKTERRGFGRHSVSFFSKGILVAEEAARFFPEHLAFVVAVVDHPDLKLQMDREGFLHDATFLALRDSMEGHICRFLEMVASSDQALLGSIMRAHSTMLLAHASRNADMLRLFRENYRFDTPSGQRSWDDLLTELGKLKGSGPGRTLYVFQAADGLNLADERLAAGRGLLVLATGHEYHLLKYLADAHGVQLADSSKLLDTPLDLPAPFYELSQRITPGLLARGVPGVGFFSSPDQELFPACLRIRSERRQQTWNVLDPEAFADEDEATITIDALLLNTAHRVVEELAGRCQLMSGATLQRVADVLFSIAVLQSPLRSERAAVRSTIVTDLIANLETVALNGSPTSRSSAGAKCFVALPYALEFDPIWIALRSVLQKAPFHWRMTRADQQVEKSELLSGILQHLEGSGRCIADLSGLNPNVLLELGMMLRARDAHTLILCDEETFSRLPTDLKGQVPMIYPRSVRGSAEDAAAWFERELRKYPLFISMHGAPAKA